MINDVHLHLVYEKTADNFDYTYDNFISTLPKEIGKVAVFLHPLYKDLFKCGNGHLYSIRDNLSQNYMEIFCRNCGKITHVGGDPYRAGNEQLLKDCGKNKNLYPFLYLALSNATINCELEFFEKNYNGKFYGIKVHPNISGRKISEIDFDSKYPLIVHCGVAEEDDPADILNFAKKYSGKVLLAHYARFKPEVLREIKKVPNVYIDTSPTYLCNQIVAGTTQKYYASELTKVKDVTELFQRLISLMGEDRIIYGSDCPWGNHQEGIELYKKLDLAPEIKQKIFSTNFEEFIKM